MNTLENKSDQGKTKIIATIGPATKTEKSIRALVDEGMDIARFNFAHGNYPEYTRWVKIIRRAAKRSHHEIKILGDLQGPRLRIGPLPKAGRHLLPRRTIKIDFDENAKSGRSTITVTGCGDECATLKSGDPIMLDNGMVELKVESVEGSIATCKIINGGVVFAEKGVNLPSVTLEDSFTEKDEKDLDFILEQKLDYIGLSFVTCEKDVERIRGKVGGRAKLVAKIERRQGVEDIDDIIHEADMIMVARGDLGIEMPLEEVPLIQKNIIKKCNGAQKPVIVATQMLTSMMVQPRPTRAEVSDVANAVLDGADYLMLSDETAMGRYPIEAVSLMRRIIEAAEKS